MDFPFVKTWYHVIDKIAFIFSAPVLLKFMVGVFSFFPHCVIALMLLSVPLKTAPKNF